LATFGSFESKRSGGKKLLFQVLMVIFMTKKEFLETKLIFMLENEQEVIIGSVYLENIQKLNLQREKYKTLLLFLKLPKMS
jgi:hypothetical protein